MSLSARFATFARYNRWANRRLYAAVEPIGDAEYRQPRGAFFGSLHGTLNHLLVGDYIWMSRFSRKGPRPDRLDAVLHDRFDDLRAARVAEDDRIIGHIETLSEADLGSALTFVRIADGSPVTMDLADALAHFFNHQTHHRGQAHCLLTQVTGAAPSFDLLDYLQERDR